MSPYTLHKAKFCRKSGSICEGIKLYWKDTRPHLNEHTWISELTTRQELKEDLWRSLSSGGVYASKIQFQTSPYISVEKLEDLGINIFFSYLNKVPWNGTTATIFDSLRANTSQKAFRCKTRVQQTNNSFV